MSGRSARTHSTTSASRARIPFTFQVVTFMPDVGAYARLSPRAITARGLGGGQAVDPTGGPGKIRGWPHGQEERPSGEVGQGNGAGWRNAVQGTGTPRDPLSRHVARRLHVGRPQLLRL